MRGARVSASSVTYRWIGATARANTALLRSPGGRAVAVQRFAGSVQSRRTRTWNRRATATLAQVSAIAAGRSTGTWQLNASASTHSAIQGGKASHGKAGRFTESKNSGSSHSPDRSVPFAAPFTCFAVGTGEYGSIGGLPVGTYVTCPPFRARCHRGSFARPRRAVPRP